MTPVELHRHIKQHDERWLGRPGVRGVGGSLHGDDGWICVYVDDAATAATIEPEVGGIRVEARVTGPGAISEEAVPA